MKPLKIFIRRPISESEIKRRMKLALKMLEKMHEQPFVSISELDVGRALLGGKLSEKEWLDDTTTECVAEFTEQDDIMHFYKAFYIGDEKEINRYFAAQKKDYEISDEENKFYTQAEKALYMLNDNLYSSFYGLDKKFSVQDIVNVILEA